MSASTIRIARRRVLERHHGIPGQRTESVQRFQGLTTTVPKELVHRAGVAEVMLTGWRRSGEEDRFSLTGQWPRSHSFFTGVQGCHDPLLAAETVRQAGILLAHTEYGVPLGHHFLVHDLQVSVRPEHMRVGLAPASLQLDVRCSEVRRRGRTLMGLRIHVEIRRDGHVVATGGGSLSCVAPLVYRRLRADHLPGDGPSKVIRLTAPVPPQAVGRISPTDVVLSPLGADDRWQLRLDTNHPVLFEHANDHVPGMVLMEAARQAATAFLGRDGLPLEVTCDFDRYAELDTPCIIQAAPEPAGPGASAVRVTGTQNGARVFSSTVTLAQPFPGQHAAL
ncbi:ScbA/BarX family gamma-butyrolactone biosynthesis protein [Streptomyces abyssomicinicus]|uniref:ScbA/BarX family gamma-butyrolactone biosynthesis protein n=1 Tax=Streptomyces abyssomicinicus TaxID=574929 RepID=UPI00125090BE|nr:ScbA/BarX family gamma-butyrolactone biosynthesis protein [Streptomyces abyssomicinicus]